MSTITVETSKTVRIEMRRLVVSLITCAAVMASPVVIVGAGVPQNDSHQSQILSGTVPLLTTTVKKKTAKRKEDKREPVKKKTPKRKPMKGG